VRVNLFLLAQLTNCNGWINGFWRGLQKFCTGFY